MSRYRALVLAIVLGGQTLLGSQTVYADFDSALEALRQQDFATALQEFRQLAEQDDAQGQFYLAGMYLTGLGVTEDVKAGISWLKKSAQLGNPQAQHSLGVIFEYGEGVEVDEAKAAQWYARAVEAGDGEAARLLGTLYQEGRGVVQDKAEAERLFQQALMLTPEN